MKELNRIIIHWTAGDYEPNKTDYDHYHYLINGSGYIITGKFSPEDNKDCTDGNYAPHCGGGNTGAIGIAICCRKDLNTPPTRQQVESCCNLAAQLCVVYGIKPINCITHAEFGQTHPNTTSKGKIDINSIPYAKVKGVKACGDYLRNKINWYYQKNIF